MDIKARVIKLLGRNKKIEINENTRFKEDLQTDSLDFMDLVFDVEGEFGIEVDIDEVKDYKTVGEMIKYIEGLVK